MWQKPRLFKDQERHLAEIRQCRLVSELSQRIPCRLITQFRLITERKQRLFTAGGSTVACDRENLLRREECFFKVPRWFCKGAVMADISA